jgi:hypothetical protein
MDQLQDRVKYSQEAYRKALRDNKKKIEHVLENRPTLLHRYEEVSVYVFVS